MNDELKDNSVPSTHNSPSGVFAEKLKEIQR
jgi:hypothetical protein